MGADFTPYQATIGVDFTYVENSIEDEDNPNKKNKKKKEKEKQNYKKGEG